MEYWFTKTPHGICQDLGINIDPRRAKELNDLFDGDIGGWYYLAGSSRDGSDEASKWILGTIAARLNELGKPFKHANRLVPADYLCTFVQYLREGRFERGFSKDVFAELMSYGEQFRAIVLSDEMSPSEVQEWIDQPLRRLRGDEVMDLIISMPKFKAASGDEIDELIEMVIASNAEQAAKVSENPKLLQWFIGQVMKAGKGKAPAPVIQEKLKNRFGQ
jgi:Asp-tRNA(Asn)/Glu-tRNA(Gln) amidotransferase B subunit